MEISIEWSEFAEKQLKEIHDYYYWKSNAIIAEKIVNGIIERVEVLYNNPLAGPKEELLIEYHDEFRYLIEKNYKIIYWQENNLITIASVFDCVKIL